MAFDFKKEYREIYLPDKKPDIILVPKMNYIAVRGQGDPNQEDGEYKQAINRKTVSDAFANFMRHCQLKNLAPHTYIYYKEN